MRTTATRRIALALFCLCAAAPAAATPALPFWDKLFVPDTIGPGSSSRLVFTINGASVAVTELSFTDTLPAGVTLADGADPFTSCVDAVVSAPDGGSTITVTEARLGSTETCTVEVSVTSSTPGTHMNLSGDLTSSAGNSGSAAADLTVATDRPGISKSFAPSTIDFGGRSTLTLIVDNLANPANAKFDSVVDVFPSGMVVADPANASIDCPNAELVATPGGDRITIDTSALTSLCTGSPQFCNVEDLDTCTVTVDVIAQATGVLNNRSRDLMVALPSEVNSGFATAALTVNNAANTLVLDKDFINDSARPGDTTTLRFTIYNLDRANVATAIAFSDDLKFTPSMGLAAVGALPVDPCGVGSMLTGTDVLSLSGGSLAPEASCTFEVTLSVPFGETQGIYTNTTGSVSGLFDGSPVIGNAASEDLFIAPVPLFTKEFTDDPVGAGDSVTLEFTITNTDVTGMASDISFIDELTTNANDTGQVREFLPYPVSVTLPPVPDPPCGAGSSLALVFIDTDRQGLELTGGELAAAGLAGDSCTFSVTIDIPDGMPGGSYQNITTPITATVGAQAVIGPRAEDSLLVIGGLNATKEFVGGPAQIGGTATLAFTLEHSGEAPGDASAITFTDNLAPVLSGLTIDAGSLPADPCGTGSTLTSTVGDTLLTLSGGNLMAGSFCSFSVQLDVPAGANPGNYTNTTSDVTATVSGQSFVSVPMEAELRVAGLEFTKEFLGDPVVAGDTLPLRFTIANQHPTDDATNAFFTDNLQAELPGLAATGSATQDSCGGSLSGTTSLTYTGGSVLAGESCVIEVEVLVPVGTATDSYRNISSSLSSSFGVSPPAVDLLQVSSDVLLLEKDFTDDPVPAGGTATLEFTLSNLDAANAASMIAFNDNLDTMLAGSTLASELFNDCSGSLAGIGSGLLDFSGGALGAGASCSLRVAINVPAGVPLGTVAENVSSDVTGDVGGLAVRGDQARAALEIGRIEFTKSFASGAGSGGSVDVEFSLNNPSASSTVGSLRFSDDLDAFIAGARATGLPADNVCGAGSTLSGSSEIVLRDGLLGPGQSCSFTVTIDLPTGLAPGSYLNTTGSLSSDGVEFAAPASDALSVSPPPDFSKSFSPTVIEDGGTSRLRFLIDNSGGTTPAVNLQFRDDFPAGLVVADPNLVSGTCGGTVTAPSGGTSIALAGGSVAAGSQCTTTVSVRATSPGSKLNISDPLTSSLGNSFSALASLSVTEIPNRSPVAIADSFNLNEDTASTALNVLANDSDPDGDALTVAISSPLAPASAGSILVSGTSVLYTPAINFCGTAVFGYTATDPGGLSAAANASISVMCVNDSPQAGNTAFLTAEDTPLSVPAPGLLSLASDPDGDVLTASQNTGPSNGTLSLSGDGSFLYTPSSNFFGEDSFTYSVSDGNGANVGPLVASIVVSPVNDAPLAALIVAQTLSEGQSLNLDLADVFSDADNDSLTLMATLPAGLALNGEIISGAWSAELAEASPIEVTVIGSDPGGLSAQTAFLLTVNASAPDLFASIIGSAAAAPLNETRTLSVTVGNRVARAASGVSLSGSVSGAATAVLPTGCTGGAASFTCVPTGGVLDALGSARFDIGLRPTAAGDLFVAVTAEPRSGDATPDDNRASLSLAAVDDSDNGGGSALDGGGDSVVGGDLDGDGDAELVLAGPGGVTIISNNGGAPGPGISVSTAPTRAVRLADMNGDGMLDLVTLEVGGSDVAQFGIRLNIGGGQFGSPSFIPAGNAVGFELADLDGDGSIDIVSANQSPNRVLLNDGTGAVVQVVGLGDAFTQDLAIGDFDGDGDTDLAFANRGDGDSWLNNGDANFGGPTLSAVGDLPAVAVADFNGDGLDDLAFARRAAPGDSGPPANPVLLSDGFGTFNLVASLGNSDTLDLIALDIDKDGDADLLALNANGTLRYYLNDGRANFTAVGAPLQVPGASSVTAFDVDGDGDLDVIVAAGDDPALLFTDGGTPVRRRSGGGGSDGLFGIGMGGWAVLGLVGLAALGRRKRRRGLPTI